MPRIKKLGKKALVSAPSAFVIALVCATASGVGAQVSAPRLTLDDYLNFEQVRDPQISPDAQQVVFTRRWVDTVDDEWRSAVWIMDADGGRARYLVDGSSPRWSPDGTRIAFLRQGEPDGPQVFVRWMDAEGAVTQITRVERAPHHVTWSPDGDTLAFVSLVPKSNPWDIDMPAGPKGASWTEAPRIIQSLDYRQDRVGFTEEGYFHVFVAPAEGGTARQLTEGDYNHGSDRQAIAWTPDGREILFSGLREADWEYQWRESEIYAVDTSSRSVRRLTDRKGPDQSPVVSPDGSRVAYVGYDWTDDTYIESKLYVMGIDGTSPREIAVRLDRSPRGVVWAPDGSGVFLNVRDRGTANVYFAGLDDSVRAVTEGSHMLEMTNVGGGTRAVGTRTSFHAPPDVVAFDLTRGSVSQLTHVNDDILAGVSLGEVEEIWYDSVDGLSIQGFVVTPPGFDPSRKYPMMLAIHGGPHGMYSTAFNFGWQEHAANGYVVLYTNPRGSSGFGSEFGNAIKNAYPGKDFDDLMHGVDEVVAKGFVDEDNLFVYGCSGGGVLTAWVVGHTDRFAAASSNCPVTNWLSFVGTTDSATWYRNFAKMFWEDPSEHLERSPIMYVGNVTTPTMLMTGVNDLRTPITQTEEYYQALKIRKVPTAMVRFNDEFHGTSSKPSNFLRTQLYLRHWFEKYGVEGRGGAPDGEPLRLSVLVPVYNEESTVSRVIERVTSLPVDLEVVAVDDGSSDRTWAILQGLEGPKVRAFRHDRNRGKGAALRTAIPEARGDYVVVQDGDLEYDPADLVRMLERAEAEGLPVVYGNRGRGENSYASYYWGGQLLTHLTNLLYGTRLHDEPVCYKMFQRDILQSIPLDCEGFEFCPEVTAKVVLAGYSIEEVDIHYDPRSFADGKKISWKDGLLHMWVLLKLRLLVGPKERPSSRPRSRRRESRGDSSQS